MDVAATTAGPLETDADTIVIGLIEDEGVAHDLPGGELAALLATGEARADHGHLALTHVQGRRFLLVGLGERRRLDAERARAAAGAAVARASELGTGTLCWEVPHHVGDEVVAGLVEGTLLRAYRFDRYLTDQRDPAPGALILSAHHEIEPVVREAAIISRAQNRARELGNLPPNELTPAALAAYALELAQRHPSISVTAMDGDAIRAAGMGAFTAVAQGSAQDARLIRIAYRGAAAGGWALALIGKALTFDSGGVSLKLRDPMWEMKFDMTGGAAVIEAIAALAELAVPVNVLGLVGAAENMPGGRATRPGDIVRALDGTTIEVNNTDAEGRLVLADCITYARNEPCERLLDIATLTIVDVALGSTYAALMCNDDAWAERIAALGLQTGELVWRLPLHEEFAAMIAGRYAQLTNRSERREAMPITAAEFLHHFAGDVPWAHLDISGPAYDVPRLYLAGKGATGYGVRLLIAVARALASGPVAGSIGIR